jgi:hypothetical protein
VGNGEEGIIYTRYMEITEFKKWDYMNQKVVH